MSTKLELSGKQFGKLTVLKRKGTNKHGKTIWECECDCGKHVVVVGSNLVSGGTVSCGCLKNEMVSKRFKKHGMRKTKIYSKWQNIKRRCIDKKDSHYKYYGGRGISVCEEWLGEHGFENFYKWAMSSGYEDGLSIERKDVNGDYCPENCTWIHLKYQAKNKTNTKRVNENKIALDAAKENKVIPSTMYGRLRKGMTVEDSIKNMNYKAKRVKQIDIKTGEVINIYKSIREAAKKLNRSCSDISLCANGKLNKAYGYIWRFENVENNFS